jgi:hypothetical protein
MVGQEQGQSLRSRGVCRQWQRHLSTGRNAGIEKLFTLGRVLKEHREKIVAVSFFNDPRDVIDHSIDHLIDYVGMRDNGKRGIA